MVDRGQDQPQKGNLRDKATLDQTRQPPKVEEDTKLQANAENVP